MTDISQQAPAKKISKKQARKIVSEKIATALSEYRNSFKEKKFDNNLKKASKLFAADIAKAIGKQKQKVKKPARIKAVKSNISEQTSNSSEAAL